MVKDTNLEHPKTAHRLTARFEPSSGHMSDKPSSACGWSGVFSRGTPVFTPPHD